jgi:hypothetical protein
MNANRKALGHCVLAVLCLAAGCAVGLFFPGDLVIAVLAGFIGYLYCGRCAMAAWRLDERVFEDRPRIEDHRKRRRPTPMAVAGVFLFAALALPLRAQQTIYNVPSADVLDPGKVYAEVDELFRPTDPEFSSTTVRGVVGVVPRIEAGVNFGGLVSPGPVVPTANVAVKIQPLKIGDFAVTVGGFGLFYLRGSEDGNPAGQGWGHLSYRLPGIGTRITVGGWYASAGYARPGSTGGALAALEQPLSFIKGLSLAADWWSGKNAIGYVSPGLVYGFGHWTAYAAYSIKNGDSTGNAGLIELGYAF